MVADGLGGWRGGILREGVRDRLLVVLGNDGLEVSKVNEV